VTSADATILITRQCAHNGRYEGSHRSRSRLHQSIVPGKLTAIIPAHNEDIGIAAAVRALRNQTRPPDRVIVVVDNCTDATTLAAACAGAEVARSVDNNDKKAGALNQILATLLPGADDNDMVLVVDADSALDPDFLSHAVARICGDSRLGAVGGVFRGSPGGGFVGHLQRNEYARYARDVARLDGRCLVVTGTAALFRVSTLRAVSAARLDGQLPAGDGVGGVYDTTVLTEDNELTFALLHLGYRVLSPKECTLVTEVMPTWRALWNQRLRWKRGAVENCLQYGITRVTWRYWGRQVVTALGVLVTFAYVGSLAYSLAVYGGIHLQPFWLVMSGLFVVERVVTVRYRGWRYMLAAAAMYELVLDMFLQIVHAKAYADSVLRRERKW
jgi:biofilm PGA synthesis N-glycosyltransferase PgaC